MVDVEVLSPERKTGEALILEKISSLEWQHNDGSGIKVYVSVISKFFSKMNPTQDGPSHIPRYMG